jgi:deoxyribose-phosphate aldolase
VKRAGAAAARRIDWLGADLAGVRGIGRFLDYALLTPEAVRGDIMRLADEAVTIGAAAVCVNGAWVALAARRLRGTGVRVASVIGFPLGAAAAPAKAAEARLATADGADELDLALNLGLMKGGEWEAVGDEIAMVVAAASGRPVKAIVESAVLSPPELVRACRAAVAAGARFVKTSTGFHQAGGATLEAVRLMRETVGPDFGVKASGGIRTAERALALLAAGANRLGASDLTGLRSILGPEAPPLSELLAATLPPRTSGAKADAAKPSAPQAGAHVAGARGGKRGSRGARR